MHSHLRKRSRRWIAALFLIVGTLSATSTAFGYTCPRSAPDLAAADAMLHAESDHLPTPEPLPNQIACGAPALVAGPGATLLLPPLRATDVHAHTAAPTPGPDPAPHDRPPLQS